MKLLAFIAAIALFAFTSCSTVRGSGDGRSFPLPGERSERGGDRDESGKKDEDGRVFPFSSLNIPKGHLPPPGECKVWFPGKEPGQQGPPQSCSSAALSAPLGAWVITHEGSRYRVNIFSRTRKNIIDEVRYYLAQ